MAAKSVPRFSAVGVDFFAGGEAAAATVIVDQTRAGGGYACFCSVHLLMEARRDARVRQALADAWTVFPDGVPIAWLGRRTGVDGAQRACGIDVMPRVIELGQDEGLRHYLFGSTPAVLARLERRLLAAYPGVRIVGSLSPPFASLDEIERLDAVEEIAAAEPDIVWCGLGAPKQEVWMHRFAAALGPAVVLGVGAAFDLVSEAKPRAPLWAQTHGLEWLHRLIHEPRRLAGRYLRTNSEFIVAAAIELARGRRVG